MSSELKKYKLAEFAKLVKKQYQPNADEELIYIGLEHIEQQTLRINGYGNSKNVISQKYRFSSGDILFGKLRPYFRKVFRPKFDGVCSTDIWVIKAKKDFDQGFLFYFLANQSFIDACNSGSSGTRMPRADWDHLSETEWKLPPLSTQRRIADILSALDDKIELNRQTNATLEAIAQAIFKKWFVENEKTYEWDLAPLPEVIEINPPCSLKANQIAPYLDMASMPTTGHRVNGWVNRPFGSGTKFINGDTLIAKITPCLENGKTAYVDFLDNGQIGWGSTEYIIFRPKPPIPPEYGYFLARSDEIRNYAIQNMIGTSGRQRVPVTCFNFLSIRIPPTDLVIQFGIIAESLMKKIKATSEESKTLAFIRDTLLPKLMSGEIYP